MLSYNQLRKLSKTNSRSNRKILVEAIRKEAQEASKRINNLSKYSQKVGPTRAHSFALDRLEGDLKSLGIKTPGSLSSKQNSTLAKQLDALQSFNRSVTSTPKGIKAQEKLLKQNMRSIGAVVPRGENWDRMLEIFSSEAFAEFESFGSSRRFAIAYEAAKRGITNEDLERIQSEYKAGKKLDEAWNDVAGFRPLLI